MDDNLVGVMEIAPGSPFFQIAPKSIATRMDGQTARCPGFLELKKMLWQF